jgi:hypothetical protein
MKWLALIGILLASTPALADECEGVTEQTKDGLILGPTMETKLDADGNPYVDREGICRIPKSAEAIVAMTCPIGSQCIVRGPTELCQDAGECVELLKVTKVRRKAKSPVIQEPDQLPELKRR